MYSRTYIYIWAKRAVQFAQHPDISLDNIGQHECISIDTEKLFFFVRFVLRHFEKSPNAKCTRNHHHIMHVSKHQEHFFRQHILACRERVKMINLVCNTIPNT